MAETKERAEFHVRFGVRTHEVLIDTAIPCLHGLSGIVKELGIECGEPNSLLLKLGTPRKGSLEIPLFLETFAGLASTGLFAHAVNNLPTYVKMLSDLLSIRKHLKSKPAKETIEKGGTTIIKNSKNVTLNIDNRTVNIYSVNSNVQTEIDRTFRGLSGDPSVERVVLLAPKPQRKVLFSATKDDFREMVVGQQSKTEERRERSQRATLTVVKPSFDRTLRWEFIHEGRRIGAYMEDEAFCSSVDQAVESFSKGDQIDADVVVVQQHDKSLNTFINREFRIAKVYEHKAAKRKRQQSLPFVSSDETPNS
jgi:hypothetical protein